TDAVQHFLAQGVIIQHAHVNPEQLALLRAQAGFNVAGERQHVLTHRVQRRVEVFDLLVDIRTFPARDEIQVSQRENHHRCTDGHAGGTGNTIEDGVRPALSRGADSLDSAAGLRCRDDTGELCGEGDEEGLLAFVKTALLEVLDDPHAENLAMVDDGHAQEGVELLLSGCRQIAIVGMGRRIVQIHRFGVAGHQADQAFTYPQADPTHGFLPQAFGGHQHVAVELRVEQVYRADLRIHGFPDPVYDDIECCLQILRRIHFLYNFSQSFQHVGFRRVTG